MKKNLLIMIIISSLLIIIGLHEVFGNYALAFMTDLQNTVMGWTFVFCGAYGLIIVLLLIKLDASLSKQEQGKNKAEIVNLYNETELKFQMSQHQLWKVKFENSELKKQVDSWHGNFAQIRNKYEREVEKNKKLNETVAQLRIHCYVLESELNNPKDE